MKHKKRFLNFLFYSIGLFTVVMLLSTITTAQEATTEEFVLDGSMNHESLFIEPIYNSYIDCGFNTMTQRATDSSQSLLENLNLNALNMRHSTDLIYYYSSSYYSKWEAEEDQQDNNKVGVKHLSGEIATWYDGDDTVLCWSTNGITNPIDSIVYGPSYHQEKWYRRWLYDDYDIWDLNYTPRFRMALEIKGNVSPEDTVCRIYVFVKYRRKLYGQYLTGDADSTYGLTDSIYLKVSDFPDSGKFDHFYLSDVISERSYTYPEIFRDDITYDKMIPLLDEYYREDKDDGQGVQFCIDWLRSDTLCTLYIDNIEVYDNDGWNKYIDNPNLVTQSIIDYADSFKTMGWSNIKHWMGGHEPGSIDSYTPIKTVDEILQTNGFPPLMNTVWALWTIKLNGESQLERYYNMVQPNKLLSEHHPISAGYDVVRPFDLEIVRRVLQESHRVTQGSGFYFHVQSYGEWENGHWKIWRFPTVPEHKAITMLALSHGTDGLIQGQYDSYPGMKGIIREGPGYDTTDIWYSLRDNIIPRIKGELGSTLLSIDYTGDYLYLGRYLQDLCCGFTTTSSTVTERYLTLSELSESTPPTLHYHTGFFEKQNQPNNNYFLLTNLITTANRSVNVELTDDNSAFINTRFRNVETENNFDTTFTDVFSIDMTIPPGEGYLYQVAPVALYGGRLLYDENVGEGQVLIDDMIIENGATMTVYSTYNANANITVKHGTIQLGENGKIIFGEGKKIIIEGACTINGTSGDKLQLVFSEILNDEEPTGIMIKAGGSLTINNCKIENATIGIESLLNANYLNVQKVDFINCSEIAVSIAGYGSNQILTPPTPQIMYCTIQNSKNGIWATNLSQIVIRENQITNTERGIYLSNVATPAVIGNNITGTNELAGIFMESCNGVVRGNRITSHTNAIHLGNSSPDVGGNTLFHNWNRGIYVGVGSLPNMRARLVQDPIHPNLFYAVSGYNRIYENGGWSEEDDGSEIFIYDANVLLGKGCNEITDQRLPNIEETPPLYNTRLLMNCIFSQQFFDIKAGGNFWDEHPIYPLEERFGDCIVYYEPILEEPCPQPDGSSGKLAITSASGETIDTLYAEERDVGTLSVTEQLYASAEEMFLTADFDGAELIYNQIVSGTDSVDVKLDAYRRLSEIGKLTGRDEIYFSELRDMYSSLAGSSSDSSLVKIFSHLSTLSLVAHQEYVPAVGEFDGIIQQNPNTEEAVYAEIDALTTALLIEETDTTLQKGRLGKYLIKSSADYNQKVDEILRKNFGSNSTENEKELLPTEYTLYQNYPNPFNPATTIKYDLPNASEVSLIIYDILGRKVKELVNTKQQAGRYEIQFNASNLASGVYIYQLMTDNPSTSSGQGFISSKKMILLK